MNKPQCTTRAQCLRELARVMELAGITDWMEAVSSPYVLNGRGRWDTGRIPYFDIPGDWEFAIGKLGGKPVFAFDEIYTPDGESFAAHEAMVINDYYSLTPPKPKTVMVEHLVGDAEGFVRIYSGHNYDGGLQNRIAISMKEALEKLNEPANN